MYTRKRGGGKEPSSAVSLSRSSTGLSRGSLTRQSSNATRLYSHKGSLRGGLIYYSCRMSLLSRLVVDYLRVGSENKTHEAIQQVVNLLLKDERMYLFISRNRGEVFTQHQPKTGGVLDYDVVKTISNVRRDLNTQYRKTRRTRRYRSIPSRAHFKMLFPFVFMEKNWNIPHYFILYYEDGKWFIYSSYSSEYVRIGVAKIEVDLRVFTRFMHCMYKHPRSPEEDTFMEQFFRTFFLADPTQQISCVENSKGDNARYMPNKEEGVRKEIDLYRSMSIMLVYVPEFKEYLQEQMKENAGYIQSILAPVDLSLKPSFLSNISSGASMSGAAEEPDRTSRASGP